MAVDLKRVLELLLHTLVNFCWGLLILACAVGLSFFVHNAEQWPIEPWIVTAAKVLEVIAFLIDFVVFCLIGVILIKELINELRKG